MAKLRAAGAKENAGCPHFGPFDRLRHPNWTTTRISDGITGHREYGEMHRKRMPGGTVVGRMVQGTMMDDQAGREASDLAEIFENTDVRDWHVMLVCRGTILEDSLCVVVTTVTS